MSVGADGAEHVLGAGEGHVEHLFVVCDQLCDRSAFLSKKQSGYEAYRGDNKKRRLTLMSHMVHVVSMLTAPMMDGSTSFQSKEVMGAQ